MMLLRIFASRFKEYSRLDESSGSRFEDSKLAGLLEPVTFELCAGSLGSAPAKHGHDVAVALGCVDIIDVFGKNCLDPASQPVANDRIANLPGGNDSGLMVAQDGIGQCADNKVGTPFGNALITCAGEFRMACHAVFSG